MKKGKRLCCLLLGLVMLLFTGCSGLPDWSALSAFSDYLTYEVPDDAGPLWVAYSSPEEKNDLVFRSVEELEGYRSVYHEYSTDTYYNALSEEDRLLYRLVEYGFDHCSTRILFDRRLGDDLSERLPRVLIFFSLDSPLVEQNLTRRYYNVTETQFTDVGPISVKRSVAGLLVRLSGFTRESLDLKLEAVEKARAVVDALPAGLSPVERARELYRYLRSGVSYSSYANLYKAHFLYDALITGATNCDGYANAYSLLCSMAGIPCFEKLYFPDEDEENAHTWNCVRLDGVWYNVDATRSTDPETDEAIERATGFYCMFGYSDEFAAGQAYSASDLPSCSVNLRAFDFTADSSDGLAEKIVRALRASADGYVYFALSGVPAGPDVFQKASNTLHAKLFWSLIQGNGRSRYIVRIDS